MGNVLVLNMGMKSIRSIIFNRNGIKVSSAAVSIETSLNGDWVVQNPSEWWEKAKHVIKESIQDLNGERIDYMTVTASSSCLVCTDQDCNALYPSIMVSDRRAVKESQQIEHLTSFIKVKESTGMSADPCLMIPKILWIKNNVPLVYENTYQFLSPNDFLTAKFTGEFVTDYFNAKKYYYDTNANSYPKELLQEVGIPAEKLPVVVKPGCCIGLIRNSVSDEIGLNRGIQFIVTSYDAICSFIGSGASSDGEASDVSGTVTVFRAFSKSSSLKPSKKIFNIPFDGLDFNIVGGSNNLGGGLIEWVKQCYYQNEKYPYELMEKDAREASWGAGGVVFLPYLMGERAPIWNKDARGVFFGLERTHTRKEMARAVFESTGFIVLDMISAIEETGASVNKIRLSGGLARVHLISQIKADITGREILVLSDFETTSTGAAMLALVGQEEYKNLQEAAQYFVSIRMIICPNKRNYENYSEIYALYKETYKTLKNLFVKRKTLTDKIYRKCQVKIENL